MRSGVAAVFGGVVAAILLGLFSWATFYMVSEVVSFCRATKPCVPPSGGLIGEGFIYVVTTVGGLVSALVIAQLSVTQPGATPTIGSFAPETRRSANAITAIVVLYLLAWIATGLTALVVGVMLYPRVLQTLSDIGTTWLGLAVSAAYAYFGLSPRSDRADDSFNDEALRVGKKVPNAK